MAREGSSSLPAFLFCIFLSCLSLWNEQFAGVQKTLGAIRTPQVLERVLQGYSFKVENKFSLTFSMPCLCLFATSVHVGAIWDWGV